MYLIPLDNDSIYYNYTALDASGLATIFLLAIAYHPTYTNLLYLLYGCTSLAVYGNNYGNINVMVRNMHTKEFLQNITVYQNLQCNNECNIKVSDNLFLIESQSFIAIYRLYTDQLVDLSSPVVTKAKEATPFIMGITRQADIYKNKYVISTANSSTFGQVTSTAVNLYNVSDYVNAGNILFVGMTANWVFAAVNSSNVSVILYKCVSCIFSGSLANSSIDKLIVPTNRAVSNSYRLYQGSQTSQSGVQNAYVFVGIGDGVAMKFYANRTNFSQQANLSTFRTAYRSEANSIQFLSFGSIFILSRYLTYSPLSDTEEFTFSYSVDLVSLSSDSSVLALSTSENSWNVQQYQMVDDCSVYYTNISTINNATYCSCTTYDDINLCASRSTPSVSASFPIGAVIGVVAGVTIAVSIIIVKKNYKRCTKGRHRTPWKYNPVQLMSFEV